MYAILRPLLFSLKPARAHAVAMAALGPAEYVAPIRVLIRAALGVHDPRLEVQKMGLVFPHPLGVAAGFDKNGDRPRALAALGFGHVELGTVTAVAQEPNPPPNMFRLPADRAIVNRLGFPNQGAARVAERILKKRNRVGVPVGVSIGKSRSVPLEPFEGVLADYVTSLRAVRQAADFIVVNISSPNTKDLRSLQASDMAVRLFRSLMDEVSKGDRPTPLLVKIAPDLPDEEIDVLCTLASDAGLAGVVATNTTISREGLATPAAEIDRIGQGGLSGPPLFSRALSVVKRVRAKLGPTACVIGVGGVHGTESALAMLRAGADLVQVYTGFVYEGPFLARRIVHGLADLMNSEGAGALSDLVATKTAQGTNGVTNGASGQVSL